MRRLAVAALLAVGGCGTTPPAEQAHTPFSDVPKHNAPRSQDTPESFVLPVEPRPTRKRVARAATQPRTTTAAPAAGDVWHALAMCESRMRQDAVSANGLYYSYFQWSLPTWRSVGGVGDPRTVGYDTQVRLAQRLQARSGWGQWPRCSRRLGLA